MRSASGMTEGVTSAARENHASNGDDRVFFACAYSPERVAALRGTIREAVESRGFRLEAPALEPGGGGLWRLISSQIDASAIGFYDYREPNMNVAAELGYALGRGKPAVVITREDTFSALPRPLTALLAVMCPDDQALINTVSEFLDRPWPRGHYDWRDLRPSTPAFEPRSSRMGHRIVVFGDDRVLVEKLEGAHLAGYSVIRVTPKDAPSPDAVVDLVRDVDTALFATTGKLPQADNVGAAGAAHLAAGIGLARGVPLLVLHRNGVPVASDLKGEAAEVTPDDAAEVAEQFLTDLRAPPPTLSLRPTADGDLLRRSLLDRLSPHRTLFLWAEPGYGKTILLSQLATPAAVWVTCTERASSRQVLATVARELTRALPGAGSTAFHLAQRPDLDEVEWRDALLVDLSQADPAAHCELVIDDAHHLSEGALKAVASISASPRVRLFVAGRRAPTLGEALAADPQVLRANDLSFSSQEAERLFDGVDIEAGLLTALYARTEGWPYALALARDVARLQGPSVLTALSGDRREIAAVFQESIFGSLSAAEREVIEAVALASTLQLDEVEWVVGRADSARILASLAERPMFVVERGGELPTYRLHSLYRDFVLRRLATSRGPAWLRTARRELARQFRQKNNFLGALRIAEEGEAWDVAIAAVKDMLPVADRLVEWFLRERLATFPTSEWEGDSELLRFAIRHDFDWGRLNDAERLTSLLRRVSPNDAFVEYFDVWAQLRRGRLGRDDLPLLDHISEVVNEVDRDASGGLRIARLELASRLHDRPSPEYLIPHAEALASIGADTTYSRPVRGDAFLQAGMIYSRAFFGAYVSNMTRLRTRRDVLGEVGVAERVALAREPLRLQSLASDFIARAGALLPIDDDPLARARFLQTVGVAQGNAALALDRLGEGNTDPGLFQTPIRLVTEAIDIYRGLRIEPEELLALTEKAQLLYASSCIAEADSVLAEVERRANTAGWPEIVARSAAVRVVRDTVVAWNRIPPIAHLDDDAIDNRARSVMEQFDVPSTDEYFANVRAEINRLVMVEREKYSHCRHIELVEHRHGATPVERLGREICPCTVACRLLGLHHLGGTDDLAEPIAVFKGRYCLGCALREPLPPE